MIYSSIYANDDLSKYPAALQRAITYLKAVDLKSMEPGEHPIEGRQMYIKVFDNTSKALADSHPEMHKKYIDVQFWAEGSELMGICPKTAEYEVIDAIESDDCYFLGDIEGEQFLSMKPGDYIILFPNDIHRPGITDGEPQTYRKAVVKVSMDLI